MNVEMTEFGNERDAHVVEDICGYITSTPPRSFFLFAGAGSGKTRTLVEVLRRLTGVEKHQAGAVYASSLRTRGQSIRVITYTKNATAVVTGRLGANPLAEVSTIHAFCWDLIQGFDEDIREALLALNKDKLAEAKAEAGKKQKGETDKDREQYAKIETAADEIKETTKFIYHPDKNTYGTGALTHDDVLKVAAWLIRERPTLRRILAERHPLILIDESQDTMKGVLDALFLLSESPECRIILGLLGDHRQRIYTQGHEDLPGHIPPEWARPALQMNHRSRQRIVELINAIWNADIEGRTQSKAGVAQHSRSEKTGGVVRIFVGNANLPTEEKINKETECAQAMAKITGSEDWRTNKCAYKTLALEHKLAAKRGNFFNAYSAMELLDKDAAMPKSNGDRTGPAIVRPLLGPVVELSKCIQADGAWNEFAVMEILRRNGGLQDLPQSSHERLLALEGIHAKVTQFFEAISRPSVSVMEILAPILEGNLFDPDSRLIQAFGDNSAPPPEPRNKSNEAEEDRRKRGWHALFKTPWQEIPRYCAYLAGEAELATHQVVKGSEFKHVMVVMDDAEAGGNSFSYDKLFGAKGLSKNDQQNCDDGKETTIDRSLRLLYVTCSRAEDSLALVLWASDPKAALEAIGHYGWFTADEVVSLD